MVTEILHKNRVPVFIACVQWFLTTIFQVDRLFFVYDSENSLFLLVKALYFTLLLISWIFVFNVYDKIKAHDKKYERGLYFFGVYFAILMLLLVVLWPGTWALDDAWDLFAEQSYDWTAWQHILTGIYQQVLLQILPFPGGIILLQNAGIALCVAFVITKLEDRFAIPALGNKYIDTFIKLLPFLTPPVLMYQFSGYRMGPYVYIELAMLVAWLCAVKDQQEWSWQYTILFSALCAVTAVWRSESLFYIPFICVSMFFTQKEVLPKLKKAICILLILCVYLGINHVQTEKLGNNSYKLVSILNPCVELIRAADPETDQAILDDLAVALNMDVIYENPDANGASLHWAIIKPEHTDQDYHKCLAAFVKLCLKYPQIVIRERTALFIKASGITGNSVTNLQWTYNFYDSDFDDGPARLVREAGWITNQPAFPTMRKRLISLLNLRIGNHVSFLYRIVWNVVIPIIALLFAWCILLKKKQWWFFIVATAVLVRVPVVYLTEPSGWLMYWLSFYFIGYVVLVYGLLYYRGNYLRKKGAVTNE